MGFLMGDARWQWLTSDLPRSLPDQWSGCAGINPQSRPAPYLLLISWVCHDSLLDLPKQQLQPHPVFPAKVNYKYSKVNLPIKVKHILHDTKYMYAIFALTLLNNDLIKTK